MGFALEMKHEVGVRIRMLNPPDGVTIKVQRGSDELLAPANETGGDLTFEFPIEVDLGSAKPNFLGKYAQGPKDARFIYVNSGTYAGEADTRWARRAKLSLMSITQNQVEDALSSPGKKLETSFNGTGTDGGPTCASVQGLVWKVVAK